jgi:hypothetical protein
MTNIQYPDGVDISDNRPKFLGPMLAPELTVPGRQGMTCRISPGLVARRVTSLLRQPIPTVTTKVLARCHLASCRAEKSIAPNAIRPLSPATLTGLGVFVLVRFAMFL